MILGEIAALKRLDHPFIVSLHFAFQDRYFCQQLTLYLFFCQTNNCNHSDTTAT